MRFQTTTLIGGDAGNTVSQYETCPCAPGCPLCTAGVGHTTVRNLGQLSPVPEFTPEPYFGTHIREALDVITDWWKSHRDKE